MSDDDKVMKIDSKYFAKKWKQFNDTEVPSNAVSLTPENDWTEIHKSWRKFCLWMFPRLAEQEFIIKEKGKPAVTKKLNEWMVTDKSLETDDMKVTFISNKLFNKVRNIQKKLGKRENNKWKIVYRLDKDNKVTNRIDWEESVLPPAPFGMECKAESPPKRGRSSSNVWEDIEGIFE